MLLKRKHEPLMFQVHSCIVKESLKSLIILGVYPMYTICHGIMDQLHHQPNGNLAAVESVQIVKTLDC